LKIIIEKALTIPVKDQILLNVEGVSLRDGQLFDSYKVTRFTAYMLMSLQNKDKLFVYSRTLLEKRKRQFIPDKLDCMTLHLN
jgi:hypothetical protein